MHSSYLWRAEERRESVSEEQWGGVGVRWICACVVLREGSRTGWVEVGVGVGGRGLVGIAVGAA
jgi:hypothetical protein